MISFCVVIFSAHLLGASSGSLATSSSSARSALAAPPPRAAAAASAAALAPLPRCSSAKRKMNIDM